MTCELLDERVMHNAIDYITESQCDFAGRAELWRRVITNLIQEYSDDNLAANKLMALLLIQAHS